MFLIRFILKFIKLDNPAEIPVKKPTSFLKRLFKILFGLILFFLILMIAGVGLVYFYEDEVKAIIVTELNKNLKSEVKIDPKNIDLTFIKTFPECALQFKKVLILESLLRKNRDTLIYAENISLLFSIKDIWNKKYNIHKIYISEAKCKLQVTKAGEENYIFWKKNASAQNKDSLNFALENILVNKITVQYKNARQKIKTALFIDKSDFSGNFGDAKYILKTRGDARLLYLQINKAVVLKEKNISYDLDLAINNSNYTINKAEMALNEMAFTVLGDLNYLDSLQRANINFKGKNIDIASVLSLLPEKYSERIKDYSSEGDFKAEGKLNYTFGKTILIDAEFGIKEATITYKPKSTQLKKVNLQGKLSVKENESFLNLQNISAELGTNTFNGSCLISNFKEPYLNLNANINTALEELNTFWPIDTLQYISGRIEMMASLEGPINQLQQSAFAPNIKAKGTATLKNIKTKFKGKENEINIGEGNFALSNRNVSINNFNMLVGTSDIKLTGELPEFLNYLFDSKMPLQINADLKSENLILEDILYFNQSSGESKKINIPQNLTFNLKTNLSKFSFSKFEAEFLRGEIDIKNQKLVVKEVELKTMDGAGKINAFADASGENILITANAELSGINISKLFYQCNNFGQNTLNDTHLKGYATSTIDISGEWDKTLKANLKSITANGNLTIDRGELMNFKPLENLSKYIEVQELRDIKFSALQSSFDIKNSVITIPKTSIKNSALNMELWGKHSFNNEIDYHIQLLLSELIASKQRANKQLDDELTFYEKDPENRRSVFILMTGTVDNPIIKYDRKGLRQKIGADLKAEKQTLKQLLKEEFGLFKNDSTLIKKQNLSDQKFKIEFGDKKSDKAKNNLQPKKKEEDDDDF